MITDIHTHNPDSREGIICTSPGNFNPISGRFYSCGLHPWDTESSGNDDFENLCHILAHDAVVAIGETGIDRLKGAPLARQEEIFLRHVRLSERLRMPLIIHEVKAIEQILSIHRAVKPVMAWVRHGFRGNVQTARMYFSKGIYLSIGEKFNPEAVRSIPDSLLLVETDESKLSISAIAAKVAAARNTSAEAILRLSAQNIASMLGGYQPALA